MMDTIPNSYAGEHYLILVFPTQKIIRIIRGKDSKALDFGWREDLLYKLDELEKKASLSEVATGVDNLGHKFFSSLKATTN